LLRWQLGQSLVQPLPLRILYRDLLGRFAWLDTRPIEAEHLLLLMSLDGLPPTLPAHLKPCDQGILAEVSAMGLPLLLLQTHAAAIQRPQSPGNADRGLPIPAEMENLAVGSAHGIAAELVTTTAVKALNRSDQSQARLLHQVIPLTLATRRLTPGDVMGQAEMAHDLAVALANGLRKGTPPLAADAPLSDLGCGCLLGHGNHGELSSPSVKSTPLPSPEGRVGSHPIG